jgi:DNA-binding transcriptional regulator LsrR (DeoR family)
MAARKRTPFQREEDLVQITRLYLQGRTQRDIAEVVGVSQGQVNHDLKLIQQRWRESSIVDMNEAKQKELAHSDEVRRRGNGQQANALRRARRATARARTASPTLSGRQWRESSATATPPFSLA